MTNVQNMFAATCFVRTAGRPKNSDIKPIIKMPTLKRVEGSLTTNKLRCVRSLLAKLHSCKFMNSEAPLTPLKLKILLKKWQEIDTCQS